MTLLLFNLTTDFDHQSHAFTTTWINALATQWTKVIVITNRLGRLGVAANVRVYSVGGERAIPRPIRVLTFYRLLRRVLNNESIDACFSHMMPLFAVLAWPLLKHRHIPLVLWYAHRARPLLLRLAHRLADRVVTSAPNAFTLPSTKLTIIGQGVETERFTIRPRDSVADQFTVVSVGRISPIKNLESLIETVALLRRQIPQRRVTVRIIGRAGSLSQRAYEQRLHALVEKRGLGDCVHFDGMIPYEQVPAVYTDADAAYNGCPTGAPDKAALESMSAGVPVVTINESFREIVGSDYDWLVVPDGNPQALASAFAHLASLDDETRLQLGRHLRQTVVDHHSVAHATRALTTILRSPRTAPSVL